ncbi:MAG: Hsp70 family protein, partial [Clostridiales bacterium]|nr:Hsp70 family protein [Clostridiales bacterium]
SLGIETLGGVNTRLIERNTTIPTRKSQVFSTAADGQTSVEVHVLQGEREMAADNKTLGRFQLTGIPPAPRGVPQIEVTFDIDANGIVHVSAKDLGTGKENKVVITASTNLSEEEVERAVKEAEKFAAEDKKRKEIIEARNQADQIVYATEKTLGELGDKISDQNKANVQAEIENVKKVKDGDSKDAINAAVQKLAQVSQSVFGEIYGQQAGQQPGADSQGDQGGTQGGNDADNVVDADYEVVDDN